LVIEASYGTYYGFNIKVKKERAIAMKVVSPDECDDFMTVGWKVSNKLPKWVLNANSWIDFNGKELDENDVDKTLEINEGVGDDKEEEDEEQEDEEEGKQEELDEGEEEKEEDEEDKEEEEEDEEEEDKVAKEEGDEEEDEDEEGQEGEQEYEEDDDKDVDLDAALCDTADPLSFRGGEK
jgi:hypothetical protein